MTHIIIANKGDQLIDLVWSDGPSRSFPSDLVFLLSSLVLFLFLTMAAACLSSLLFYYCIIFSSQFIVFHSQYLLSPMRSCFLFIYPQYFFITSEILFFIYF